MASLAASFGRGAMTNHWNDIANSDCIMIIGSNAAENHPLAFKHVTKAKEKGATLISVDPRYTRTASLADIYAPLRSGTDIAFINSIINYALTNDLVQSDYLLAHTNASFLVNADYELADGIFGEIKDKKYTKANWGFQKDAAGIILKDKTLTNENCVYQLLKKHFSRYDFETVSKITGTPVADLKKVAEAICATHKPEKSAVIMYAMGTTQHTYGTQNIRSYAILQTLLGNIGVAGGGIDAMRGESNVQGSTDFGLLFHIIPGYLKAPTSEHTDLETYLTKCTPTTKDTHSANWWSNYPKYITSMLKSWWGDEATKENDYLFNYLPKSGGNYSHIALFEEMEKGTIKGCILLGQNPAVGGPNSKTERNALKKLEWMVAVDLWETETASFWKDPEVNSAEISTEVFLLPAASSVEKEGSVSNSSRWAQWRYAAVAPPGEAKSDLWILDKLQKKLKILYAEKGTFADPITKLSWNYGTGEDPDAKLVAKEINGYFLKDVDFPDKNKSFKKGDLVPGFAFLKSDGSTSCGCWIYSASYINDVKDVNDGNMMARRKRSDPEVDKIGLNAGWAWCWPVNRRIIYNRASCNAQGVPYAPDKPVVKYDWVGKKWLGDVSDGPWPPMEKVDGSVNADGKYAFIMMAEGHASLFADLLDGPLPEHYEPVESPVTNLISKQQTNPVIKIWRPNEIGASADYPIVATTYRVSEHWQAGAMTRNLPWLAELVPNAFVEISNELAEEKGIENGDKVKVSTIRGSIDIYALVTSRLKPFQIDGKTIHEVGLIWQFGYAGIATGPSANDLTPHVGDANTSIPEYKAFLCNIEKA